MTAALRPILAVAVGVVAVAVVAAGLFMVGSPGEARLRRLDERRVNDLRRISRSVSLFWTVNEALPESLAQLTDVGGVAEIPEDPEGGASYSYRVIDAARYELCAVFARSGGDAVRLRADEFWAHAEGRQCFELAPTETGRRGAD